MAVTALRSASSSAGTSRSPLAHDTSMSMTLRWQVEHRTSRRVSSPALVAGPSVRLPPHRGQRAAAPVSKTIARTWAVSSGENIAGVSRRRSVSTRRSLPLRSSNATATIFPRRGEPRRSLLRSLGLKWSDTSAYAVSLIRIIVVWLKLRAVRRAASRGATNLNFHRAFLGSRTAYG